MLKFIGLTGRAVRLSMSVVLLLSPAIGLKKSKHVLVTEANVPSVSPGPLGPRYCKTSTFLTLLLTSQIVPPVFSDDCTQ